MGAIIFILAVCYSTWPETLGTPGGLDTGVILRGGRAHRRGAGGVYNRYDVDG